MGLCTAENPLAKLTNKHVWLLLGGCVCDSLALISMCIAFQATTTTIASMVAYLAIVYAVLTDIFVFGDSLSVPELLGCAAVVGITIFIGIIKSRRTQVEQ